MTEEIYTKEEGHYLQKNPSWHIEDSPWKAKQILKMIDQNKLKPRSIVEIGCGVGEILNQLLANMPDGVMFKGYDISPDAIKIAKKRETESLKFKQENFLETNEIFDLLLMVDVFEHVEDYIEFLSLCKGRAKNTIFHIPLDISVSSVLRNKLIHARNSVGHLHYFTKETAIATLLDTGYEIVDYFYTAGSIELPRKTMKSKFAVLPRKLLYSINKDFAVKALGGFSLLVLAR